LLIFALPFCQNYYILISNMELRSLKRVLVADDTLPMRVMLQDVLSEAGYDVVTAEDGEKAWNLIQSEKDSLDLLILDLLMPGMTGFEILEKLKEQGLFLKKSLVITGIFKSGKEVQRLKELGVAGYITKTALVDEILFRVNQVFYLGQEDTRRYPRVLASLPVYYGAKGEKFSNYSSNFSAGGLFIRTIDPLLPGQALDLNFNVPDLNMDVVVKARVVWNNEYEDSRLKSSLPGMGVEFIDLDRSLVEAFTEFVNKRKTNEPVWID